MSENEFKKVIKKVNKNVFKNFQKMRSFSLSFLTVVYAQSCYWDTGNLDADWLSSD